MSEMEDVSGMLENIRTLDGKGMIKTIELTPEDQAVMMIGIHGIGKSEFVKDYFTTHGYAIITLFLGQMADAGDLIGLPDRTVVNFKYGDKEISQKITEFCPPKWWPRDDSVKLIVFLDEFNRGKPEVYQCIMNMALNRELNGLALPKDTRIIAAINPLDDKYGYQVTELDPALFDRFNVYGFAPTTNEWIYWAIDNKVNKFVISFIAKYGALHLDPPSNGKMGVVYPSRRSWVRLSSLLNKHPGILAEDNLTTLSDIASGIVGEGATSSFYSYIRDQKKGIHPGRILTAWDKEIEEKVKSLKNQDLLAVNASLALHIEEEEDQYFGDVISPEGKRAADKYAYNLWQYLKTVPREIMANFYDYVGNATIERKKTWPKKLLDSNVQGLVDGFIDIVFGNEKNKINDDIDLDEHFRDAEI